MCIEECMALLSLSLFLPLTPCLPNEKAQHLPSNAIQNWCCGLMGMDAGWPRALNGGGRWFDVCPDDSNSRRLPVLPLWASTLKARPGREPRTGLPHTWAAWWGSKVRFCGLKHSRHENNYDSSFDSETHFSSRRPFEAFSSVYGADETTCQAGGGAPCDPAQRLHASWLCTQYSRRGCLRK